MQILGFPVQVLGEPDVHSRHAHIIRTSWDDWQAGGKRGLSTPLGQPCRTRIDTAPQAPGVGRGRYLCSSTSRSGPLRRSCVLSEERIVVASALITHLRKRTNAQRFTYLLA